MSSYSILIAFHPEYKKYPHTILKKIINENNENKKIIDSIQKFFQQFPDFNPSLYKKYQPFLKEESILDLCVHWYTHGQYQKYIYSFETFSLKYPFFDIEYFKKYYIRYIDSMDIIEYYHLIYDDYIFENSMDFYNHYPFFNWEEYARLYSELNIDSERHAIFHFIYYGQYQKNQKIEIIENNSLNNNTCNSILNLSLDKSKKISSPQKSIVHLFYHFMEIGGGERYLSQLAQEIEINPENKFFHYILVHTNNKDTYFNSYFNYHIPIITYETLEEANIILQQFPRIIDHQFYWYDISFEKIIFNKIVPKRIIRFIHGSLIHYDDITLRKFHIIFDFYNEKKIHSSWNNIIKFIHPLGTSFSNNKICDRFNSFDLSNILIIGRICNDKVPEEFLEYIQNNIYHLCDIHSVAIPNFHFYGMIDKSYEKIFNSYIDNNPLFFHYHGIVEPSKIDKIYAEYDILFHPSLHEAASYTILEAMSMECLVLTRPVGGLIELVNPLFHCSSSSEFISNYISLCKKETSFLYEHIQLNKKKIQENHSIKIHFTNVLKNLYQLYKIDEEIEMNEIPNIIHYIFGLEEQTQPFPFMYYLSILSNIKINKPHFIYFHYQYLPYGDWWDKIKDNLILNYISISTLFWKKKPILKTAHKADKIRMDMLYKYGGIYMDIDTISYSSYKKYLKHDFVIGIQEVQNEKTFYGNAILMSKPKSIYLLTWMDYYPTYFKTDGWCEASIHLMSTITDLLKDKIDLCILPKEAFYYPLYTNINHIFETPHQNIEPSLITLHWWNTKSKKYLEEISNFEWFIGNSSLYAKLMKEIYYLQ